MNGKDFSEVVRLILKEDGRYERGAYYFLREALDHTVKAHAPSKVPTKRTRHVNGATLCEGIREFALEQYGPMAAKLLATWGISKTSDFGNLVYNLVDYNVFGLQESDRREDFDGVYDFFEAFERPFLPARPDRITRYRARVPTSSS